MTQSHDRPAAVASPDIPPSMQLWRLIEGFVVSQVVGVAARLGVADHLSSGPKSSDYLACVTGADPDVAPRFLRACAAIGLLEENEQGMFALTPLGDCLRWNGDGQSLRNLAITNTSPGFWLPLGQLIHAVKSGQPSTERTLGMKLRQYYEQNPEEAAHFAAAMSENSVEAAAQVATHYDGSGFTRIVDVGGSRGDLLATMLQAAPAATGVLFDRPEAVAEAGAAIAARGLADRVEIIGGSLFEEVPPGGDLYVLKTVLCDWNDEHAARILDGCRRAAAPETRLLIADLVLPADRTPSRLYVNDLMSLAVCGGRLRTVTEFEKLLASASYRLERTIATPSIVTLLEARRL